MLALSPIEAVAFATMACLVFATYGTLWVVKLSTPVFASRARGRSISFGLLLLPLVINLVAFRGRDAGELLSAGLSSQNIVQVVGVGLTVVWAAWLLATRRVAVATFARGPCFWATLLVMAYLMSSLWSVWPALTAFRSVELAAVLVLAVHVFVGGDWPTWVRRYLLTAVALGLVTGVVFRGPEVLSGIPTFGVLRANTGGLLAATLFYLAVHARLRRRRGVDAVGLIVAVSGLYAFGSLAAVVAMIAAMPLLFTRVVRPWVRRLVLFSAIGLIAFSGAWIAGQPVRVVDSAVEWIAAASNKRPEAILSISGRAPLWRAIGELTRYEPLGMGFAAAERLLTVSLVDEASIGWSAMTAHSGYVSAWIGAGILGISAVVALLFAISARALRSSSAVAPFVLAVVALLAVNNLTIIGVGGIASPSWVLVAALCVAPTATGGVLLAGRGVCGGMRSFGKSQTSVTCRHGAVGTHALSTVDVGGAATTRRHR